MRRGNRHRLPLPTKKLSAIDTCWEKENQFPQMKPHWVYEPQSRAGPRAKSRHNTNSVVSGEGTSCFILLSLFSFLCFFIMSFIFFFVFLGLFGFSLFLKKRKRERKNMSYVDMEAGRIWKELGEGEI